MDAMAAPLIELTGLTRHFTQRVGDAGTLVTHGLGGRMIVVQAVTNVDLSIAEGEVMGLVGEPGCGKSTLARMLVGTLTPTRGTIRYRGDPVDTMTRRQKRGWTIGVQMMFQDRRAALNPRLRAAGIIGDAPVIHGIVRRREASAYVAGLMDQVGLDPARVDGYPHEFLPHERHRIALARALAVKPSLLVCDQVAATMAPDDGHELLDLVTARCRAQGVACLLISDRMDELELRCDRIAVMYRGRLLEVAPAAVMLEAPNHPYSQTLLAALRAGGAVVGEASPPGRPDAPGRGAPTAGCIFQPHCSYAGSRCREESPTLQEIAPGHRSACHLNGLKDPAPSA